jgi:hypothetical protein
VDGVLDDEAWARASVIEGLVQVEPVQGATPSEQTEVRIVYDANNLYFGVVCRDRTPAGIVSTQLGRDSDLEVDDQITIVIDPFGDQRNGFFFSVNPAGARRDGQISNNAQEMSTEWDGIWDARARKTAEGWVAEIAIPFKTLRFKPGQTVWGLNIQRQIKRRQEIVRWAGARNDVWVSNLAAAGRLEGLEGLHQGRGLDIRPFVSGGQENSDWTSKVGLDVVKSITPNMTAALTVNTDFAETEVDALQTNLTRFPLFFPEKRYFFLENAGIFDFGTREATTTDAPLMKLFFSRRIGLGPNGEEVPIDWGVRTTGRAGVDDVRGAGLRVALRFVVPTAASHVAAIAPPEGIVHGEPVGQQLTLHDWRREQPPGLGRFAANRRPLRDRLVGPGVLARVAPRAST